MITHVNAVPVAVHATVRLAVASDIPALVQLEQVLFGNDCWTDEVFRHVLATRDCVGRVAEHNGVMLGYCVHRAGRHYAEILNLGVHPLWQRFGVGRQLVELLANRGRRLTAYVVDRNLGAQLFFRSLGFRCVRIVPGYYEGGEDGYLFVRRNAR